MDWKYLVGVTMLRVTHHVESAVALVDVCLQRSSKTHDAGVQISHCSQVCLLNVVHASRQLSFDLKSFVKE